MSLIAIPIWLWGIQQMVVEPELRLGMFVATVLAMASRSAVPFLTLRGMTDRDRPGFGVIVAPALVVLQPGSFVIAAVLGVGLGWLARRLPALSLTEPARGNSEVVLALARASVAAVGAVAVTHLPPLDATVALAVLGAVAFATIEAALSSLDLAVIERWSVAAAASSRLTITVTIEVIAASCGVFVAMVVATHGLEPLWLLLAATVALALAVEISGSDHARARYRSLVELAVSTDGAQTPQEAEQAVIATVSSLLHAARADIRDHPPIDDELGAALDLPGRAAWLVVSHRRGLARPFTRRDRDMLHAAAPLAAAALRDAAERAGLSSLLGTDPLTGLANRRAFDEGAPLRVETNLRLGRHTAVAVLDLDDFKPVNDDLGHEAGDAVLTEVSRRLRNVARADDIVARLGGDEFVVVAGGLPHSPVAEVVGDRIRRELEGLTAVDGRSVGVSVGVAVSPADGLGIYDLLRAADRRMYTAKRSRV